MMDLTMQVSNVKPKPGTPPPYDAVSDWIFANCKLLQNCTAKRLKKVDDKLRSIWKAHKNKLPTTSKLKADTRAKLEAKYDVFLEENVPTLQVSPLFSTQL